MAAPLISVTVRGAPALVEALAGVDTHARRAQASAMRAAARKGRSLAARAFASRHGVPLRVFRKRVRFFLTRRNDRAAVSEGALWAGLRFELRASTHAKVAAQLRAQHPRGFAATMPSGHRGWFKRKHPSRRAGDGARTRPHARGALPIVELGIDVAPGAPDTLRAAARKVMATTYPDTLKRDYLRRLARARRRRR